MKNDGDIPPTPRSPIFLRTRKTKERLDKRKISPKMDKKHERKGGETEWQEDRRNQPHCLKRKASHT